MDETAPFGPDDPVVDLVGSVPGWSAASTRVLNAFARNGIVKVGDLTAMTEAGLREMDGFGDGCVAEVRRVLAAHGMAPLRS